MAEEIKKSIGFYLLYGVTSLMALLPFSVLYFISDILYFLVYRLVGYRKKVVRKNLLNSFPDKEEHEILNIEKRFYHHLCDYFVETIKTLRVSDKEIRKRMVFRNPEIINRLTKDGNSCLLSLGHYGNWEWVPSIVMYLSRELESSQVYKRLSSSAFDSLFLKLRSRFNSKSIEMRSIYRTIVAYKNLNKAMVIGFLSDQRPRTDSKTYVTEFLNQQTHVFLGMEHMARRFGFSVVYLDIKKVKRGHYIGNFSVITADGSMEEENTISEKYIRKLEETVLHDPACYLWSHDKWKYNQSVT